MLKLKLDVVKDLGEAESVESKINIHSQRRHGFMNEHAGITACW